MTIKKVLRNRLTVIGGLLILLVLVLCAFSHYLCPGDAHCFSEDQLSPPSAAHLFGTDSFGRDLLRMILHSGGQTLSLAFYTLGLSAIVGITSGVVSGFFGGFLDTIVNAITETLLSFPAMMTALFVMALFGTTGRYPLMIAISLTLIPRFARVLRGTAMSLREKDFIVAARATGTHEVGILYRHVFPNLFSSILVLCSVYLPYVILIESSLSFLGLGAPPDAPTWGRIVAEGKQYFRLAPWLVLFPGMAIAISAIGFNLLGDGLRDLLDPYLRGRYAQRSQ